MVHTTDHTTQHVISRCGKDRNSCETKPAVFFPILLPKVMMKFTRRVGMLGGVYLAPHAANYVIAQNGRIFNNYSLKSRWIAAEYSTEIEKNNCFSIHSLSDLNNTFCGLLCVFWYSILDFQYFRFTNGGETRVCTGYFVVFGSRFIHSVGSE